MTSVCRSALAGLLAGASLIFGCAGTAHAHGTWSPPVDPPAPQIHVHHGPFSVLHQGGPFSVLRQTH